MSRQTFTSEYDFYRLNEEQRIALIGSRLFIRESVYFPLGLNSNSWNYGVYQGLIFVTPIMNFNKRKWFRVGVCSPDDLDMDLDFGPEDTAKRVEIIDYLIQMNKNGVSYESVLNELQAHFGGERTS